MEGDQDQGFQQFEKNPKCQTREFAVSQNKQKKTTDASPDTSSEDDGDATWKAAIESVAVGGFGYPSSNGVAKVASGGGEANNGLEQPSQEEKAQAPGLKLYQIKVRNMLDDMLEKNLEIVRNPCSNLVDPVETGGGIKLFKKAPPGITMDTIDKYHVQLKRPRILPRPEIDEKSKKFRHMLQSVVVDGNDVLVSAKEASQISLARMEARETAAKAKAKREEERVTELKKVRGEKWLPSIATQMKEKYQKVVKANEKIDKNNFGWRAMEIN